MTIDELIERLEEYREALGGDIEIRLMSQPNWPFEYSFAGLVSSNELRELDEEDFDPQEANEHVLYLVEGTQLGYGSKQAWEACD